VSASDIRSCADKLAEWVAKNGRQFEDLTRDKNPGETPFKFLHDKKSPDYAYYSAKVQEWETKLGKAAPPLPTPAATPAPAPPNPPPSGHAHYAMPAAPYPVPPQPSYPTPAPPPYTALAPYPYAPPPYASTPSAPAPYPPQPYASTPAASAPYPPYAPAPYAAPTPPAQYPSASTPPTSYPAPGGVPPYPTPPPQYPTPSGPSAYPTQPGTAPYPIPPGQAAYSAPPGTAPYPAPPVVPAATPAAYGSVYGAPTQPQAAPPGPQAPWQQLPAQHAQQPMQQPPLPASSHAASAATPARDRDSQRDRERERDSLSSRDRDRGDRRDRDRDRDRGNRDRGGEFNRERAKERLSTRDREREETRNKGSYFLQIKEVEAEMARGCLAAGDSVAAMDAYMKLAAKKDRLSKLNEEELEEERRKARPESAMLNETSFDRRRVTAVYKQDGGRGHHMQDFIPPEELAKLAAKSGDKASAEALEKKNAIGSNNIGHKMLSKMGWKEGQGLGATQAATAITTPITAGAMNQEKSGLGAGGTEEESTDDPFEAYRKRMMLGYKYRPNPLGNPRKQYY